MKRKYIAALIIFFLIIAFGYFLRIKTQKTQSIVRSHIAMDTNFRIKIILHSGLQCDELFTKAFSEIDRIEEFAMAGKNSRQLWIVKDKIYIQKEKDLLLSALLWEDMTEGAFSPAIGALTSLWDIPNKGEYIPPEDSIDAAIVASSGYRYLYNDTLYKEEGLAFDLGGIAKGYALQNVYRVLDSARAAGAITEFLIDAGRSIAGYRDSDSFVIGIQNPRMDTPFASFLLPSGYFCSSCGDYERYFIKTGIRYHHILDPQTGYPARRAVSATVIGPDGTASDALSTAVFVSGPEKGMELIENLDDFFCMIIYIDADSLAYRHNMDELSLEIINTEME